MTSSRPHQLCPPFHALDGLERLRLEAVTHPSRALLPLDPSDLAAAAADGLEVVDPEGLPVARYAPHQIGATGAEGVPEWLDPPSPRPYEHLFLNPDDVRSGTGEDTLPIVVDRLPTAEDVADVHRRGSDHEVLLLVLAGPTMSPYSAGVPRVRRWLEVAEQLPSAQVVAVPLDPGEAHADGDLLLEVVAAYARVPATSLTAPDPGTDGSGPAPGRSGSGGLVLFLTGLSGSGKSTVARSVRAAVLEEDGRPVSLLDGDTARRNLSAGLSFSPADRDVNVRRIGWVAAEVAHHGGMAICSPIAPYDGARRAVRAMTVDRGGDFVLVHVSTPLHECARRDRKGLYARARSGEIPDFTGVSAPYEVPTDADLVLDTTDLSVAQARDQVLDLLRERGHLTTRTGVPR